MGRDGTTGLCLCSADWGGVQHVLPVTCHVLYGHMVYTHDVSTVTLLQGQTLSTVTQVTPACPAQLIVEERNRVGVEGGVPENWRHILLDL